MFPKLLVASWIKTTQSPELCPVKYTIQRVLCVAMREFFRPLRTVAHLLSLVRPTPFSISVFE